MTTMGLLVEAGSTHLRQARVAVGVVAVQHHGSLPRFPSVHGTTHGPRRPPVWRRLALCWSSVPLFAPVFDELTKIAMRRSFYQANAGFTGLAWNIAPGSPPFTIVACRFRVDSVTQQTNDFEPDADSQLTHHALGLDEHRIEPEGPKRIAPVVTPHRSAAVAFSFAVEDAVAAGA